MQIMTWFYDEIEGRDIAYEVGTIDYDPASYKNAQEAADDLFEKLDTFATNNGYGEGSVSLIEPEVAEERGYGKCWMVSWEDGPYQWAIFASAKVQGPWGYVEPHHSFDLCFWDERT